MAVRDLGRLGCILESGWIQAALWLTTKFPAQRNDTARWLPTPARRLTPFQALLPGTACYVTAPAALISPQLEWCGIGHLPRDRSTQLLFAPRVAPTHCARAALMTRQSTAPCPVEGSAILGTGAASCNLCSCQLEPCVGLLTSRELSVLQKSLVSVSSTSSNPTKSSDRVKTQVPVCTCLISGFLNWANATDPPECRNTPGEGGKRSWS